MAFKQGNLGMRLLLLLVFSLLFLQVAQAQTLLIPEELHEFARENGWNQIQALVKERW